MELCEWRRGRQGCLPSLGVDSGEGVKKEMAPEEEDKQ